MLRLWGRLSSINVRKVVWTAQELSLTLQRTDAGGHYGLVRSDAFLHMNPNGMVPVIEDDGFVLWESNAIVRYLCAKQASGGLFPNDVAQRFVAEQWMDWQQTTLNPAGRAAFIGLVRTPPEQRDMAAIQASVNATEPLMTLLNDHLASRPFLLGEQFTMADIPIACEVHRWWGLPPTLYLRSPWPHLERWFAGLRARPAAQGVLDLALE